jgi:hypothetical protein
VPNPEVTHSFNQFVGAKQQRRRYGRPSAFAVLNNRLYLRSLLDCAFSEVHCLLERKMKNGLAFTILGIAMTMVLVTSDAFAGDEEIWGTYKLINATNKYVDTGDTVNSFGEHPKGYITYGKEGRMLVLIPYYV